MADPVPGGGTQAPIEAAPGGDMASAMVAEMEALSQGAPPAPEPAAAPAPAAAPKAGEAPKPAPAAPKPAAAAPKAAPKPAVAPPAKTTPPPAAKPPGAPTEPQLDWNTAPAQFRAAHQKLSQVHQETVTKLQGELQTTQTKMRDLEGKKFLSPEQEQKYQQLERDQQQLRAELYSRDFRESPEFKSKYEGKAKTVFKRVDTNLKSLTVDDGNGDKRPAVMSDFQKIQALGDNPIEQRRTAKALFGEDADVILADARELQSIQTQANEEIEAKRNGFQSEREKQHQTFQQESEQARQSFTEYDGLLEKTFPQYFAPIEGNEDYNKAREEGLKYVDTTSSALGAKTPAERARQTALLRRWAAAFPATQVLLKQRGEQIAALESQIAKLKGTDPGEMGEGGQGGGGGDEGGGTQGLSDEIDAMMRQG